MSWRDEEDMTDDIASGAEMSARDEREASLFDDYDDPSEQPASAIYAARSIGTTGATPLALRFAAMADTAEYGNVPNVLNLPAETKRGAA